MRLFDKIGDNSTIPPTSRYKKYQLHDKFNGQTSLPDPFLNNNNEGKIFPQRSSSQRRIKTK